MMTDKKVLAVDFSKKRPKIGNPPSGRFLPAVAMATVTSIDDLPPSVFVKRVVHTGSEEIRRLNFMIETDGGDPIVDPEKWKDKVLANTRGHPEIHPSADWIAAFYRGETDD